MPLNGTGTYAPPSPEYPAIAGEVILASDWNAVVADIAAALSEAVYRDGQQIMTDDLNFGTFKSIQWGGFIGEVVTGLADEFDLTGVTLVKLPADTTATTQTLGNNTTKVATTAFVKAAGDLKADVESPTFTGTVTIPSGASIAGFAPLASPSFTGTPTAPTAATGTNTTQIATMAALLAQAFLTALPSQSGNAGKFVTTDGTDAYWEEIPPPNQLPILALGII
jgi:hypothetical protein